MTGLRIDVAWQEAEDVSTPELQATWSRMRLNVGTECLTLVEDNLADSYRKDIDVAAYPLAEWMAFNWWFLVTPHAGSSPAAGAGLRRYVRERQNLAAAGDGFSWPPLGLFPEEGCYLLSQSPSRHEFQRINYVRSGQFAVEFDETVAVLEKFVDGVVRRLEDRGIAGTRLQSEWETIQAANSDEIDFCRAAAALGFDPYSMDSAESDLLIEASSQIGDVSLLLEILPAINPSELEAGALWLADCRKLLEGKSGDGIRLREIQNGLDKSDGDPSITHVDADAPWKTGYARARAVRDLIGIPDWEAIDLSNLIETVPIGIEAPGLVEALVNATSESGAAVVSSGRSRNSARFIQARTLSRCLFSGRHGVQIVSHGGGVQNKIERAFAAELLAPALGISELASDDMSEDSLDSVANRLNVSRVVVDRQIDNQILGLR